MGRGTREQSAEELQPICSKSVDPKLDAMNLLNPYEGERNDSTKS